jgi:hypothetical protein
MLNDISSALIPVNLNQRVVTRLADAYTFLMTSKCGHGLSDQFIDLIYGSIPAEFESAFSLDESVQRLSAATRRSMFSSLFQESAVGPVSARRVSLQHVIPFFGNAFKPFFIGRFSARDGRVVLAGRFTMLLPVRVFLSIWFGFCALWTATATIMAALAMIGGRTEGVAVWILPIAGTGMFFIGLGFTRFARDLSAKDVPWLSHVIQDAFSNRST